jgi:hypothetical protein
MNFGTLKRDVAKLRAKATERRRDRPSVDTLEGRSWLLAMYEEGRRAEADPKARSYSERIATILHRCRERMIMGLVD